MWSMYIVCDVRKVAFMCCIVCDGSVYTVVQCNKVYFCLSDEISVGMLVGAKAKALVIDCTVGTYCPIMCYRNLFVMLVHLYNKGVMYGGMYDVVNGNLGTRDKCNTTCYPVTYLSHICNL